MKRITYTATWLDKQVKITEKQLNRFSCEEMVTFLNNKGMNLGSGHDGLQFLMRTDKSAVLNCTPYIGAPTQNIEFELIN